MSDQQNNSNQSLHSLKCQQQEQIKNNQQIKIDQEQQNNQMNCLQNQSIHENQNQQNKDQQSLVAGTKKKIHKKSEISNFIIKTYRILQDKKNKQIIQWTDQGNCFIVKNKDLFENQILPKYFKHKKFSSFVRQLNMYDFHKIRKQKEIPIFKHKYFKMGCIELLHKIKRKSGDQIKDQEENQPNNLIPSLAQLTEKPAISAYSIKSKSHIPYPTVQNLQSAGMMSSNQLDQLLQQNQQLNNSISDLIQEQVKLQLQKQKNKQKVTKMLNAFFYFNIEDATIINMKQMQINTIRDLQNHIISDQQPYNFSDYIGCLRNIYSKIQKNLYQGQNVQDQQKTY